MQFSIAEYCYGLLSLTVRHGWTGFNLFTMRRIRANDNCTKVIDGKWVLVTLASRSGNDVCAQSRSLDIST